MKIALVGPGIIEIPPKGWGAVESLIWDYATELGELGHEGVIINTPDPNEIISELQSDHFDFIHVHYDVFYYLMDTIRETCPNSKLAISSHYPYIDQPDRHPYDGYDKIYKWLISDNKYYNFCISEKDYNTYLNDGADESKLLICKNGAQHRDYSYTDSPTKSDRTLYLGKIEKRKRQSFYQTIPNVDYVGKYTSGTSFDRNINYLGEWDHQTKLNSVTEYGNMLLLSDGENGTPLVIKEALICGLGVVVSKYAAHDLDKSLPFVTVIDEDKWNDIDYVKEKLEENRNISLTMRDTIRNYGVSNFSWETLVKVYVKNIESMVV
jgi:glycosyltransferase involved in cell wall biosynthesis